MGQLLGIPRHTGTGARRRRTARKQVGRACESVRRTVPGAHRKGARSARTPRAGSAYAYADAPGRMRPHGRTEPAGHIDVGAGAANGNTRTCARCPPISTSASWNPPPGTPWYSTPPRTRYPLSPSAVVNRAYCSGRR